MKTIEQKHELSLFLLCLWGILTLYCTGQVNPIALIVALVGITCSYVLKRRGYVASVLIANFAGALMLILSLLVFFDSGNLLDSTVYLFLFLQVIQFLTSRNLRQLRWCYLISFFQIIAGAVLTTGIVFGILFLVYVFLFLFSLRLYSQRDDSLPTRYADLLPGGSTETDVNNKTRTSSKLFLSTLAQSLIVFLLTGLIFTVIPRLSSQNQFQTYGASAEKKNPITAFDETVQFGSMEQIQEDNGVALYVQPTGTDPPPDHVRLRGVALDTFDGSSWKRTGNSISAKGQLTFRNFTSNRTHDFFKHKILQPPGITRYLFGNVFPQTLELSVPIEFRFDPLSNSAWLQDMLPKEIQYEVTSTLDNFDKRLDPESISPPPPDTDIDSNTESAANRIATLIRETLRDANELPEVINQSPQTGNGRRFRRSKQNERLMLEAYLHHCLQVPDSLKSQDMIDLGKEWTQNASTPFEKAMAIEHRFKTTFGYTLQQVNRGNYIKDFLFRNREGHCEYFATSMAMLMRNLGVPARIVNGYYSSEWNNMANSYIVRQRNAHSWVEVYLGDDYGWMTFDPTPPSGIGRSSELNTVFQFANRLLDTARIQWYRYVIDYSLNDQLESFKKLFRWQRRIVNSLNTPDTEIPEESGKSSILSNKRTPIAIGIAAIAALLLLYRFIIKNGVPRFSFTRRQKRKVVIHFYESLLRSLAKRGIRPIGGITPREFAAITEARFPELNGFSELTEIYYSARYNSEPITTNHLKLAKNLNQKIRSLKKQIK